MTIKFPMLAVLLKKHYSTRVAETDSKVSNLDGKIIENKTKNESINNELKKLYLIFWEIYYLVGGEDGSQA